MMENGVEIFDSARLEEKKGAEDEIVEPRAEDKSVVGLDVAKESEGEEVFEEAIEPETPGAGIEDETVRVAGNADSVRSVANYMEENENLDSKDEDEMFEEAVETSLETQQTDDESRQKTDMEHSVEEQGASEKVEKDEAQWVDKNSIVENGKDEVTEIADLDASVEIETVVDRTERDHKSGELLDLPENGVSDHLSFGENQTHHDALETNHDQQDGEVHGIVGTQEANEAKGGINDVQKQVHSYKDALLQDEKNVVVIERSDVQPAGHQDLLDVHKDVSVSSGPVLKDETDIELHIVHSSHLGLVNSDVRYNKQKDLPFNDTSTNGHHGEILNPSDEKENAVLSEEAINGNNKNEEQVDGPIYAAASTPQGGSTHLNIDAKERAFTSPEPKCQEHMEELKDIVSGHATDHQGVDSPTVGQVNLNGKILEHEGQKEVLSSDATDHQGLQGKESPALGPDNLNDKADAQQGVSLSGTSASENHRVGRTTTAEDEGSKSSEGLISDNVEKVYVSLPESVSESSNVSQLPVVDASVGVNKVLVEESEKCTIIEELKQNVHGVREPEARSARDIPSSSGASTTRTTTPARPAGLGRAAPLLEPAPRMVQHPRVNGTTSSVQNQLVEEPTNGESEEYDETREKLQMIRVKFLRLAHRLGQTPHNVVVAQVLYRLGLAEQLRGRNGGRVAAFSFDRASAMAEQLEAAGQEALDFCCTIMVLGKTGVGKSATVNSIFDEVKFGTDAFQTGTKKVQDVVGTVQGIKVRIIDTPGLLPSWSDQRQNEKILHSVKRFIKKSPPDIVLYLDRLDVQSRDYGDMPLLRTITEVFGPSIWFNAIVVLTHAASAPPEGPNGTATSYDMFVTQRSHVVQQAIRQTAGDMRLMNPVSLVENHSACRTNRAGQRVLPNGQVWKPHLLLLSFASKILAEANTLLKLQDSPPGRPYATRTRSPPLPFLLSSLLQSRPQVKLPAEQFGDEDEALDEDLDESSDSEDESEYDQLPPFKRLTKVQLAKLTKDQKKAYNDELEYREKLFVKKQLKEERKRRRMMKKMQAAAKDLPTDLGENVEEETGGAASVPVPMPDFALPASFDSDNPTHRYRYLDSSNQWLVRPVLEPNGWDHDVGYEGINVEKLFVVKDKIPISFSSQVSKDKKDANLQMELASSLKHGNGKATSLGFDMQSVGKDLAYTLRSETRFSNYRKNKATVGLSATLLGDVMTGGVKLEDKLMVNNRGLLVVSGGAMFGRGDVAYGGSLEATLRDKDHPLGRFLSTLGISVMDWHGDLAIGCNSQTQIPIGRYTNLIGRVNINNKGSGQVSIRLNSSEQLQIALISLVPLVKKLLSYSQPVQYG